MATTQMSEVIQHLRRTVLLREGAGLTDGQLLEDYISRRDATALAVLVRRHGPMVWGVCRRVLRNYHDAEDAFQATFLVLTRKAASVMPRGMVANWLYGVAHQTALKARATAAKRKGRERQMAEMPEPAVTEQQLWRDLQPLLDEELSRLPDKYRVVIVLCDLEGKTRKEAAGQLGCPEGSVAGWLARARTMLAKRLARHGLAVPGGALAAVLAQNVASAGVPASVVSSTIQAASLFAAGQAAATGAISVQVAALTQGVLKTMLLTKLKVATSVLLLAAVAVLGVSVASFRQQVLAQQPADKLVPVKVKDSKAGKKKGRKKGKKKAGKDTKTKGGKKETVEQGPSGVVKAVDAAKGTITMNVKGGEKTYTVAKDASVKIDGKPGKLADVPVGDSVILHLTPTVQTIQAAGLQVAGKVKAVAADESTLTVTNKGERTFEVAKDAKIVIDGKPGKLADLKEGMAVDLRLGVDKKTVVTITAGETVWSAGGVKAVDAAKPSITVNVKGGKGLEEKTYTVAKDASVEIDGKPGKLADVPVEASVTLKLSKKQATAFSVRATTGPLFGGDVTAVDAGKNTITVRFKGSDQSFTLPKDATVVIDGKPGKLADVPEGASVILHLTPIVRSLQATRPKVPDKGGK